MKRKGLVFLVVTALLLCLLAGNVFAVTSDRRQYKTYYMISSVDHYGTTGTCTCNGNPVNPGYTPASVGVSIYATAYNAVGSGIGQGSASGTITYYYGQVQAVINPGQQVYGMGGVVSYGNNVINLRD